MHITLPSRPQFLLVWIPIFKRWGSLGLICWLLSGSLIAQINSSSPMVSFGSNVSYVHGTMPSNLPTGGTYGVSQDAADAYIRWKSLYTDCSCSSGGLTLCKVLSGGGAASGGIVSEGIAYGMLLAAYAGDKALFDGLYAYYDTHKNCNGVMNWKIGAGCPGTASGINGAADAEVDAAMALIVAETQWPSATSPFDYAVEAMVLVDALMDYEIDHVSTPLYQLSNGDGWMGYVPCPNTPRNNSNSSRNPGYQAAGYYPVYASFYANADPSFADATLWGDAASAGRTMWYNNEQDGGGNGLISNWSNTDGTVAGATAGSGTPQDAFGYEACRGPWRMAVDALWHGNVQTIGILSRQRDFFLSQGGANSVGDGYKWDGTGSTGNVTSCFVALVGAGALGTGTQTWIDDMYTRAVQVDHTFGSGNANYYNETLRTMGLFVMTGNFWNPAQVSTGGPLPVNYLDFRASQVGVDVALDWAVVDEGGEGRFTVLHALDGQAFQALAALEKEPGDRSYSYLHRSPEVGLHYYQITHLDHEGREDRSSIQSMQVTSEGQIQVQPNPSAKQFLVALPGPFDESGVLRVYDLRGRIVEAHPVPGASSIEIGGDLQAGVYYLVWQHHGTQQAHKIVKLRD
ncbi:MAG: glycosyl hydrolase family 8 [Bacteroidota bacterium]